MPIDPREQILTLLPGTPALLALAEEGLSRVRAQPADLFTVVSTFVLVNSLRDWTKHERGLRTYWPGVPYSEVVREVANGTKHLVLNGAHHELHVEGMSPEDTWDTVDWDELGSEIPMITLLARRRTDEPARWRSAKWVLEEALDGWRAEFGLPDAGYAAHH